MITNITKKVMSSNLSASEVLFKILTTERSTILYGATSEALWVIRNHFNCVYCVVDMKRPVGEVWHGVNCLDTSAIVDDYLVINCVTAAHHREVYESLAVKHKMVINFFDLVSLLMPNHQFSVASFETYRNWCDFPVIFAENVDIFLGYKALFKDDISRQHYVDYLDGKILGDIATLAAGKQFQNPSTMYFQDFLGDLSDYTFVDIGCFDGANSEAFLKIYPGTMALCIEPNSKNIELISSRMKEYSDRYTLIPFCLGESEQVVTISLEGSSSKVGTETTDFASTESVGQTTLDSVLKEHRLEHSKVFIKMDVEGSELSILRGAKNTIENENAIFAISCYHKSSDLIDFYHIFSERFRGRSTKVYFRHLTSGACETVLFIV